MRLKLLCGLMLFIFACSKVNQWKQPTSLCFEVVLEGEYALSKRIHYTGGVLSLQELVIEGQRREGADVYFPIAYDSAVQVPLGVGQVDALTFEVPQGQYTQLNLLWKSAQRNRPDIIVEGTYETSVGNVIPMRIELPMLSPLEITYQGQAGRATVALKVEKTSGIIQLDTRYWLINQHEDLLEKASYVDKNGHPLLLINSEHNSDLYQIITNRFLKTRRYNWVVTQ